MPPKNKPYPKRRTRRRASNSTSGNTKTVVVRQSQPKVPRTMVRKILDSGSAISKIFGWGAYSVKSNSLWDGTLARQVPHMQSNMESITFRHREYIGDISSSILYAKNEFDVNPGLDSTFPYLSNIARNFQQYRMKGLIFEFKSTSASALNSTNTALGTVALAMQYQTDAPSFTSKGEMLNEMWSVDGKPSEDVLLPIECDPSVTPMMVNYIRSGDLPSNRDKKMYDLGRVTVATVGSQAIAVVGELWVSYEVELHKPQAQGNRYSMECAHYSTTGNTNAEPLKGPAKYLDNIGCTITSTSITFPTTASGRYFVQYSIVGGSVVIQQPSISVTNCTLAYDFEAHTGQLLFAPNNGETATRFVCGFIIDITTEQTLSIITLGGAGTVPTAARGDIVIIQVADNFD